MAEDQQEVKPEEVVVAEPTVVEAESVATPPEEMETPPDSSTEQKPIEPVITVPAVAPVVEPAPVDGETPREKALRIQVEELRAQRRADRAKEIPVEHAIVPPKELSAKKQELLKKYNPDEVKNLEELIDTVAEERGWVRKEEFQKETFQKEGNDEVQTFIDAHPEYDGDHDKDGLVWNRLKEEFGRYRPATSRKELRKNLEDAHQKVFGIQPSGNAGIINAQREKVKVASHAGASQGGSPTPTVPKTIRLDMLKGYDDEEGQKELAEIARRAAA